MEKYDLLFMARDIFPTFWQNSPNNALCDVLLSGCFGTINDYYGNYEAEYREKVGYSIQRKSLERSLNDKFDISQRRITVENGEISGFGFVFNEDESTSEDVTMYVFNDGETLTTGAAEAYVFNEAETSGGSKTSFTVYVPISLLSENTKIESWIERVLILGTNYSIVYY